MKNQDIRKAVQEAGLKLWQVAEKWGIADCNFSRKLRHELSQTDKERIYGIIEELKKEELANE